LGRRAEIKNNVGPATVRSSFRHWNGRSRTMVGFITERHLKEAEEAFPGITRFFQTLAPKPRTFLELVSRFEGGFASPTFDPRPARG